MSQIQIDFKGIYQLDNKTSVVNPTLTVTSATDNFVETVSTVSLFTGTGFSYSRDTGVFEYQETWDNQSVIDHLNAWMNDRKI